MDNRDGYLPIISLLSRLGVSLHLTGMELHTSGQPACVLSDPEMLLLQVRAGAGALKVPICAENSTRVVDEAGWVQMERSLTESVKYKGIDLPQVGLIAKGFAG